LPARKWWIGRAFEKVGGVIEAGIRIYTRLLGMPSGARAVIGGAFTILALVVLVFGLNLRREFFPEVDAGAFEIYVRAKSGTRIEVTEA
jgi:multidrug efflux pump subunit AcrB